MKQFKTFTDERLLDFCAYCGGPPGTRDHVPPKTFLDRPYEHAVFCRQSGFDIFPEVGGRLLMRLAQGGAAWVDVQTDRFGYLVEPEGSVRMLVRGYLAAEVVFDERG